MENVIIVEELSRKRGQGEGLISNVLSASNKHLNIRLHAAEDSFMSIGIAATATLPSKESIIKHGLELANG